MRFTKDTATKLTLPPGKSDHLVWDPSLPGFGIRARGNAKRWVIQYRINGRQRREAIGDVRKVELSDARRIAKQRFASVELGVDPAAERAKARAEAAALELTLGKVAEQYLAAKADVLRPNTLKASRRYFNVHWKPLRDHPIDGASKISRADIAAHLQRLSKERGRIAAARARATLSALFAWAMQQGLCEANVVTGTHDPEEGAKSRERTLDDRELRLIWNACDRGDDFSCIVRLLLLLGCRREEIGGLRWSEIDLETGLLCISGERTKNHRELRLPLPSLAIAILRSVRRRDGRDFVFGKRHGFNGWSAAKRELDARIAKAAGKPLAPWRLHDARRTMRSGLGKLGVMPHVAEIAIGHSRKGIEAVYDRHRYEREVGAALALWADHVLAIAEGCEAKVIPLARA
jgi:integrase